MQCWCWPSPGQPTRSPLQRGAHQRAQCPAPLQTGKIVLQLLMEYKAILFLLALLDAVELLF